MKLEKVSENSISVTFTSSEIFHKSFFNFYLLFITFFLKTHKYLNSIKQDLLPDLWNYLIFKANQDGKSIIALVPLMEISYEMQLHVQQMN